MVQNYADVAGGRCGARTKQESFTKTSGQTGTIKSTQNVPVMLAPLELHVTMAI